MTTNHSDALLNLIHVVISSTVLDLPLYRRAAMDGVWRSSMHPIAMERDRIALYHSSLVYSYELVNEAHIYIGIFANRYGAVIYESDCSITEEEYRRAVKNDLPILIFMPKDDVKVAEDDTEHDSARAEKLKRLKVELKSKYKVSFFTSPDDLNDLVSESLSRLIEEKPELLEKMRHILEQRGTARPIPEPHELFFYHHYTLENRFIGRKAELRVLDAWGASSDPVLLIDAIGGMGKSALTWHWMRAHAATTIPNLHGSMWFSFYESDATMGIFQLNALAYLTGRPLNELKKLYLPRNEREQWLLDELHKQPILLVMDGIERLLNAYARVDVMHISDKTIDASDNDNTTHQRQCADPRDGAFLRSLINAAPSKILISTRLVPKELQEKGSKNLLPGVSGYNLPGLTEKDAVDLFHALDIQGSIRQMQRFANHFGSYALLVQVVAGYINNFFPAPCDFDAWYKAEGRDIHFLPWQDLATRRENVLAYAFKGLDPAHRALLGQIATFRFPVAYHVLQTINPFVTQNGQSDRALNRALSDLIERGLIQWDRQHNSFDLHPIVRSYAFNRLDADAQQQTYNVVRGVFAALPPENPDSVQDVSDVSNTIELYLALVGARLFDEAAQLYLDRLEDLLTNQFGAYATIVELLTLLFPQGTNHPPKLAASIMQQDILSDIAFAYVQLGELDRWQETQPALIKLALDDGTLDTLSWIIMNYVNNLSDGESVGAWHHAAMILHDLKSLFTNQDDIATAHTRILYVFVATGQWADAEQSYQAFIANSLAIEHKTWLATATNRHAVMLIAQGQPATEQLEYAWKLANEAKSPLIQMFICNSQGEDALLRQDAFQAEEFFIKGYSDWISGIQGVRRRRKL